MKITYIAGLGAFAGLLLTASSAFADLSGAWSGIISDKTTHFSSGADNISLNLSEDPNTKAVTGTLALTSQSQAQYTIVFNVEGSESVDKLGHTKLHLTPVSIVSSVAPGNMKWHAFKSFHFTLSEDGNSLMGGWITYTLYGNANLSRGGAGSVTTDTKSN